MEKIHSSPVTPFFQRAFLIVSLLLLTACASLGERIMLAFLEPENPPKLSEGVEVLRDIEYAKRNSGSLLLDLYRPSAKAQKPLPTVLFFYGGGFEYGNKNQLGLYKAHDLPLDGFAVVAINYRLSGVAPFPAAMEDAKAAVKWIKTNADQYNLDANNIAVWGASAGGMMEAFIGTSTEYGVRGKKMVRSRNDDYRVQAVVNYFGATDFSQGDAHEYPGSNLNWAAADSWPSLFIGAPIANRKAAVQIANPITYVTKDDPPMLIIHGEKDDVVPLHQSLILHDALEQAGVPVDLRIIKDGGHGRGGDFDMAELKNDVARFLSQHLNN